MEELAIAKTIKPAVKSLARSFSRGETSSLSMQSADNNDLPAITMDANDAEFFKNSTRISDTPITVSSFIISFDRLRETGELEVFHEQAIPPGRFRFAWKTIARNHMPIINAMTKSRCLVTVRPEYELDEAFGSKIARLHIDEVKLTE